MQYAKSKGVGTTAPGTGSFPPVLTTVLLLQMVVHMGDERFHGDLFSFLSIDGKIVPLFLDTTVQ